MVYQYRRKFKRRNYKRKVQPWYNRKYNAMDLATKAAKGVWYLKGLVNSEMLHVQQTGSTTINNTTGTMTLLNGLDQNDTASGRTGNSVLVRNVFLKLNFIQNSSIVSTFYRVMLVQDTQQIGDTNPVITDILESANVISPLATSSVGRFKVLKNWNFSTDDVKGKTYQLSYYKDLRMHTRFNGTANTDIQKNGLYLVMLSNQATNTPTVYYSWKVGYHDN